jgi:hypothetical protein
MSVHWLFVSKNVMGQWHAQMLVLATHSYRNLSQIKTIFDFAETVKIHTHLLHPLLHNGSCWITVAFEI